MTYFSRALSIALLLAALPVFMYGRDLYRQTFQQSPYCSARYPADPMYVWYAKPTAAAPYGICHYIHRSILERIYYGSFS